MENPEKVYLLGFSLHAGEKRPTINFSNAAEKGFIYTPISKDLFKDTVVENPSSDSDNNRKMSLGLPVELMEKFKRGEVELMMPEGGLHLYIGKDVREKIAQVNKKKRKQLIHTGRSWRM